MTCDFFGKKTNICVDRTFHGVFFVVLVFIKLLGYSGNAVTFRRGLLYVKYVTSIVYTKQSNFWKVGSLYFGQKNFLKIFFQTSKVIPRLQPFRIPQNACFDNDTMKTPTEFIEMWTSKQSVNYKKTEHPVALRFVTPMFLFHSLISYQRISTENLKTD